MSLCPFPIFFQQAQRAEAAPEQTHSLGLWGAQPWQKPKLGDLLPTSHPLLQWARLDDANPRGCPRGAGREDGDGDGDKARELQQRPSPGPSGSRSPAQGGDVAAPAEQFRCVGGR